MGSGLLKCLCHTGAWRCHFSGIHRTRHRAMVAGPWSSSGAWLCPLCHLSSVPSRCRAVAAGRSLKLCSWGAESRLHSVSSVPLAWWAPWDRPKSGGRIGADADPGISGEVGAILGCSVTGSLICLPSASALLVQGAELEAADRLRGSLPWTWASFEAACCRPPTQRRTRCPQLSLHRASWCPWGALASAPPRKALNQLRTGVSFGVVCGVQ